MINGINSSSFGYLNNQNKLNNKKNIAFGYTSAVKYVVKKPQLPVIESIACVGNATSGMAYLIAGPAMLYEFVNRKKNGNSVVNNNLNSTTELSKIQQKKEKFFAAPLSKNQSGVLSFSQLSSNKKDKTSFTSESGINTITPQTEIGKKGLKAARFATATAGAAGFVNGIAMKLPVLAIGEGTTGLAAPIIETPVGLGIFGIGLAAINLARVLDTDPKFKIDPIKFKSKNIVGKAGYIATNMGQTFKALLSSTGKIGKEFTGLFTKDSKKSRQFFKQHMFSTNPTQLIVKESVNKEGKVILEKAMKTSPYLMHFATLIWGMGATSIIAFNKMKMHKAEKGALRAYNSGNAIDNVALTKWGAEKLKASPSTAYKASGAFSAVAGVTALSGQAGLDKDWGRGLYWSGVGLILSGFAIERGADVKSLWKNRKAAEPVKSLVRQWKVELDKMFTPKELKEKVKVGDKETTRLKAILGAVNKGEKLPEDKITQKLTNELDNFSRKLQPQKDSLYNTATEKLKKDIENNHTTLEGEFGKLDEVTKYLTLQSEKLFGKNPVIYKEQK